MNRDLGIDLPRLFAEAEDDAQDFREKRRFLRRQLAVRCWMADGTSTVYARVHDVSLGGLSIRARMPFQPDTELDLAIVLPSSVAVRATGRVVWVRSGGGLARMGAEFVRFEVGRSALVRMFE